MRTKRAERVERGQLVRFFSSPYTSFGSLNRMILIIESDDSRSRSRSRLSFANVR